MAKLERVEFLSDLSEQPISDTESKTLQFALDGQSFEIDLSAAEQAELRQILERYVSAARRMNNRGRTIKTTKIGPDAKTVRAWAQSHGIKVPDRGRIPEDVRQQFEAAN
ncbi:MAG: histone-like nucleoid-structuring protein Lsr2 [Nocardioidaceae bacterium]